MKVTFGKVVKIASMPIVYTLFHPSEVNPHIFGILELPHYVVDTEYGRQFIPKRFPSHYKPGDEVLVFKESIFEEARVV
jgi:hypothetical protein